MRERKIDAKRDIREYFEDSGTPSWRKVRSRRASTLATGCQTCAPQSRPILPLTVSRFALDGGATQVVWTFARGFESCFGDRVGGGR